MTPKRDGESVDKELKQEITIYRLLEKTLTHLKNGDFAPNMTRAILRNDPLVSEWLARYPKSTQSNYLTYMNEFIEASSKRPKDLLTMEPSEIKRLTKSVMGAKIQKGNLYAAKGIMDALKSFAAHYEKPIKFTYGEKVRVGKIKNHIAPKSHQVYAIAEAASACSNPQNPRNKAIILLGWVTALRNNAVTSMKAGSVMGYTEDDCPIPLKVGNKFQKLGGDLWCIDQKLSGYGVDYYYTFIAKEAFVVVEEWLNWRKHHIGPFEQKDPLFCQVHTGKLGYKKANLGGSLSKKTNWNMFKDALPLVHIDRQSMTFHKLRNAFKSIMISAGVDEEVREVMMGHAPPGSQKNYFEFHDVDMVRKEYKKADFSRVGSHRLDKVEEKNLALEQQVKDLQAKLADNGNFQTIFMNFMKSNVVKKTQGG